MFFLSCMFFSWRLPFSDVLTSLRPEFSVIDPADGRSGVCVCVEQKLMSCMVCGRGRRAGCEG